MPNPGPLRMKDDYDGVEPSANSQQALNALRLYQLTGNKLYQERLRQQEKLFTKKRLEKEPQAMTTLVSAIIMDVSKPATLVLGSKPTGQLREMIDGQFRPSLAVKIDEKVGTGNGHLCRGTVCGSNSANPIELL